MRILGRITSINVRKVLWTCAELELPYERVDTDAALLARNPNAMVPVIRDGDFVLWESNAICRYLAGKNRHAKLLPDDLRARALTEQWMDWQAGELNNSWRYAFLALSRKSPDHTNAGAIAASVEEWNRHMGMLDEHLGHGGGFVTGEYFTLADVVLGLAVHRWYETPLPRPHYDALHGYYQRLSVRPAFRASGSVGVP